jgi:hypothetical protein
VLFVNRENLKAVTMMENTIDSSDYEELIFALENNPFDIAGLAEFQMDEAMLTRCFLTIQSILRQQRSPRRTDRIRLAQVLYALVSVAREDYASQGHQELWPFLFRRIGNSSEGNVVQSSNQQDQRLIGEWFRTALEEFGYSVPKGGQTNIGPIVFHSGIPRSSLPGAMQVISDACKHHGFQAENLPVDIRKRLVENFQPALHKPLQRLLGSDLQGASQLWSCLARVVLARQSRGDCSTELAMLPTALDPELVRNALPENSLRDSIYRRSLSVLRYDVDTGDVRMVMPFGDESNWKLTSPSNLLKVQWDQCHDKLTADFRNPLPPLVSVSYEGCSRDQDRTIHTRPRREGGGEWPGIWFHAHNGNIEDGRTIDTGGLSAGRWFVLFEGNPTKCSVPIMRKIPLKWSFTTEGKGWNAFEIEVPVRTEETSFLEWQVGDESFRIPLARRASAKLQFTTEAVATATTIDGNTIEVFAKSPSLELLRDRALEVLLAREIDNGIELVESLLLQTEKEFELQQLTPGIYRICEARGVGRVLLRFALLPGLKIDFPTYSGDTQTLVLEFDWDLESDLGSIHCKSYSPSLVQTSDLDPRVFMFCTSQPFADLEWIWSDTRLPTLSFRFAMMGLRWRVTGIPGLTEAWTRNPILLDPSVIAQNDAQLEIQITSGSTLLINDSIYSGQFQHTASGDTLVLPLASFGECVELTFSGEKFDAVVKCKQPILNFLRGIADQEAVIVEWETVNLPQKLAIVVWDPFDFQSDPKSFPLSAVQMQEGQCVLSNTQLPNGDFLAVSVASVLSIGFSKRSLHYAVSSKNDGKPIAILVQRESCNVFTNTCHIESLPKLALDLSLSKLHQLKSLPDFLLDRGIKSESDCDIDPSLYLRIYSSIESIADAGNCTEYDQKWADQVLVSLRSKMADSFNANTRVWQNWVAQEETRFSSLLRLGIPLGQKAPFSFSDGRIVTDHSVYPIEYIYDLWVVSLSRSQMVDFEKSSAAEDVNSFLDDQRQAAARILDFHRKHELPSPFEFLPLTERILKVTDSNQKHTHAFSVVMNQKPPQDDLGFAELLGLDHKSLDCSSITGDQYFNVTASKFQRSDIRQSIQRAGGKKTYSLFWDPKEELWFIENQDETPPLCCKCRGDEMTVANTSASHFADGLKVRYLINSWSKGTSLRDITSFDFLSKFESQLEENCFTGDIHSAILKKPRKVLQECLGTEVYVDEFDAITETARIAWQLSWLERYIAWEGRNSLEYSTLRIHRSDLETRFPVALAEALDLWPQLMRRCLALAEIFYWTCHRRGIGIAAKYR